jgi:hypothetical protein
MVATTADLRAGKANHNREWAPTSTQIPRKRAEEGKTTHNKAAKATKILTANLKPSVKAPLWLFSIFAAFAALLCKSFVVPGLALLNPPLSQLLADSLPSLLIHTD